MAGLGAAPPSTVEPSPWGVRWCPRPAAPLRLFCLPHAGGGAGAYRLWAQRFPVDIEVVAIRLPGRETRHRETPLDRFDRVVNGLLNGVRPWLDRPYAWFGHSMGALIAYEAGRRAAAAGLPQPVRLLVSGRVAPHVTIPDPPVHAAPIPALLRRLRDLGGTPPEVLEDAAMLRAMLPIVRADFAVAETYRWQPGPVAPCPLSVFGATGDRYASSRPELEEWARHTADSCVVRLFPGGHFFLHEPEQPLLAPIIGDLREVTAGAGPRR